ncbi:hypothetical protein Pla108_38340 [Botrimarina colliarenosi]|uniref:PEP-CTERM protein-sorting domain-containing protein n=1 Tax=Botrimarina colliarenosi TaxID=2528001 RepID=A0A5C6A2L2_9BACT|nr:hypothetical protein [Botrimarina colliarenosi]TWT94122.1 hypothetical protein Pla108_38340 [Botrimarina colliarenosi]
MIRSLGLLTMAVVGLFGMSATATAGLVYVDAEDGVGGNTALDGGGLLDATDGSGGATWRQRDDAAFGSGPNGSVFEGVEPSPLIQTTISGLTPGASYQVNVHFWDPQSEVEDWNVSAGFTPASLQNYSREADATGPGSVASVLASSLAFDVAPTQFGPNSGREMLSGDLGVTAANGAGEIIVYVDDLGVSEVNRRSWYDGVSYQAVPEPTAALLIFSPLFALVAERRRQAG